MRSILASIALMLIGCGSPSAGDVKAFCSASNACIDAMVRFCDCCNDPDGGLSCDNEDDLCTGARRMDGKGTTSECRIVASLSCEFIQDEADGCL